MQEMDILTMNVVGYRARLRDVALNMRITAQLPISLNRHYANTFLRINSAISLNSFVTNWNMLSNRLSLGISLLVLPLEAKDIPRILRHPMVLQKDETFIEIPVIASAIVLERSLEACTVTLLLWLV